jgi:hypothetical protein
MYSLSTQPKAERQSCLLNASNGSLRLKNIKFVFKQAQSLALLPCLQFTFTMQMPPSTDYVTFCKTV